MRTKGGLKVGPNPQAKSEPTDGAAGFDLFGNGTLWAVAALFVDDILFGGTWTVEVDAMKKANVGWFEMAFLTWPLV